MCRQVRPPCARLPGAVGLSSSLSVLSAPGYLVQWGSCQVFLSTQHLSTSCSGALLSTLAVRPAPAYFMQWRSCQVFLSTLHLPTSCSGALLSTLAVRPAPAYLMRWRSCQVFLSRPHLPTLCGGACQVFLCTQHLPTSCGGALLLTLSVYPAPAYQVRWGSPVNSFCPPCTCPPGAVEPMSWLFSVAAPDHTGGTHWWNSRAGPQHGLSLAYGGRKER